ncbi:diaminohydroxyphosphoribosylaminopyrimidine deaminase/5-amino-6-(5-phosphoribosylamino)uracil reductase [Paucibacter oligotrophus]|uniref:Riboflavin biosynthesis protein RibD n=1 Tax=Roseateles oligotrophus TaxID=1769250 RepID=A0A840L4R4_9BURK|nr:bifunctional diaminohydroxyphosphoribosylaminopyrimidine deaminase/5-amino-6-(5-phosphoribosylamino)uracil reductase RibD [Roseateles oligotrophus]MBB4843200.1 diaminohydroxyphosphoribosylaminopyrimidine deaminase/5-amino-6-(5-phosphoribosylamino)uracil reductase [Roseateles oligotrophus]
MDEATRAIGLSDPNPRVGCVIVGMDGATILGKGYTQRAGGAHAEVMALRDAQAKGHDVRCSTAYVTLEPCAHFGRTPPCCDALVAAGLGRVHIAVQDPNPAVQGQGAARLRAAGIRVEWAPEDIERECRGLNIGFLSRMERGRPWVRMKMAVTLDGYSALTDGRSQWITSPDARQDGHHWRSRSGAILTGIGTVLRDDPAMTARLEGHKCEQPLRCVVDARLEMPLDSKLLKQAGPVRIYTACGDRERRRVLKDRGVSLVDVPTDGKARLDLPSVLADIGNLAVNELHVEAGARLSGALFQTGMVDELLIYMAPRLLSKGAGLLALPVPTTLDEAPHLRFESLAMIGTDARLQLRVVPAPPGTPYPGVGPC